MEKRENDDVGKKRELIIFIQSDSEHRRMFSKLLSPAHDVLVASSVHRAQLLLSNIEREVDYFILGKEVVPFKVELAT